MYSPLSRYSTLSRPKSLSCTSSAVLILLLVACQGKNPSSTSRENPGTAEVTAPSLITKNDCLNCHSIRDKSVGPSYEMIAQRYDAGKATVDRLTDKIILGGGGLWGGAVMTKHPLLKKEHAAKMVQWILSLDDSLANRDPMSHTDGVALAEVFGNPDSTPKKRNGLMLHAYSLDDFGAYQTDFPDVQEGITPLHSGVVNTIHFPNPQAFEPLSKGFVLQATGFIHIKSSGRYFFRQVKAGKGRFFIDGNKKINEEEWDSEIVVDLSPGVYPVVVDYQSGEEDEQLSLQWITPDDEYYRVIPEDAFTYN